MITSFLGNCDTMSRVFHGPKLKVMLRELLSSDLFIGSENEGMNIFLAFLVKKTWIFWSPSGNQKNQARSDKA